MDVHVCPQARLEDHRRLLAAQECEADERERLRMEVRAALELRVRFARSAESRLRALHIPMEYDTVTNLPNISKAVRRALLFYHPDRYQVSCSRATLSQDSSSVMCVLRELIIWQVAWGKAGKYSLLSCTP
jgi:hypothetical protein